MSIWVLLLLSPLPAGSFSSPPPPQRTSTPLQSTPRSNRSNRSNPYGSVSPGSIPSPTPTGWNAPLPPPGADRSTLERYVNQMESILFADSGGRRTLTANQVNDIQDRIQQTEDRIRTLLGYDAGGLQTRVRRRRGVNQESATATNRENLGQGDHRTTTTTRTTTTVRHGQRPVSRRSSESVSIPLSNSSTRSDRSNRSRQSSRQSGTGRKKKKNDDVAKFISFLKKQKRTYGHLSRRKSLSGRGKSMDKSIEDYMRKQMEEEGKRHIGHMSEEIPRGAGKK